MRPRPTSAQIGEVSTVKRIWAVPVAPASVAVGVERHHVVAGHRLAGRGDRRGDGGRLAGRDGWERLGSMVTFQSVGGVAVSLTSVIGAVPVLVITNAWRRRRAGRAARGQQVVRRRQRHRVGARDLDAEVGRAVRSPACASTLMGYVPGRRCRSGRCGDRDVLRGAGVDDREAACLAGERRRDVPAVGPVAVADTVRSCAVSFLNCRSKVNVASDAPVRVGVVVVRVMSPAAAALTRIAIGSTSCAPRHARSRAASTCRRRRRPGRRHRGGPPVLARGDGHAVDHEAAAEDARGPAGRARRSSRARRSPSASRTPSGRS